jgi:hypothetical protein
VCPPAKRPRLRRPANRSERAAGTTIFAQRHGKIARTERRRLRGASMRRALRIRQRHKSGAERKPLIAQAQMNARNQFTRHVQAMETKLTTIGVRRLSIAYKRGRENLQRRIAHRPSA